MEQTGRLQVDRLVVENFRSIKHCDVSLPNLTFLVGRNGSGKSTFLDALQFVSSAVNEGFAAALADRNGLSTVLYRPSAIPAQIKFKLWFSDSSGRTGSFEMHVRAASWSDCSVTFERCQVFSERGGRAEYQAEDGRVSGTIEALPPPPPERLYLSAVSGFEEFGEVFRLLGHLVVSEYSPKGIHLLLLRFPKSYSFPSLVKLLLDGDPSRRRVVESYIRLMVPGFVRFEMESAGGREWVVFIEKTGDVEQKFYVTQISDGTLYAAQIMLDLFVRGMGDAGNLPVLVEEPGGSLHPWAAGVLRSALEEAALERQVIVTTHSPDLIDGPSILPDSLRAVYRDASGTHIEKLGDGAVALLHEGVCTPGDLLRRGALTSDNEPEFIPSLA